MFSFRVETITSRIQELKRTTFTFLIVKLGVGVAHISAINRTWFH